MRTKLLLTIAALLLATGTANANDQLPEYILGRWCAPAYINTKALKIYFRPDHVERDRWYCSDLTDGININQEGYDDESPVDDAPACSFSEIKRKEEFSYLVHVLCKTQDGEGKPDFEGQEEFQLVNGLLFKKRMPEG